MSELTLCNFCNLNWIKKNLRPDERIIIVKHKHTFGGQWPNGVSIHVVWMPDMQPDEKNFKAWFAELPESCHC